MESFVNTGLDCKLFLNIYITTILHPSFRHYFDHLMKTHPSMEGRLVLEINESSAEELWQNAVRRGRKVSIETYVN